MMHVGILQWEGDRPKKGCKDIAKWKEAPKQPGGVVANKATREEARRSQSVSTNAGRVNWWSGADQGSGKRKVDVSETLEGEGQDDEVRVENKRARNGKRVSFNEAVKVGAEVQSGGSQRPVRSTAWKEKGFFCEELEREERFRCKNCKARFSSKGKLLSHNMKYHRRDDDTQTVV